MFRPIPVYSPFWPHWLLALCTVSLAGAQEVLPVPPEQEAREALEIPAPAPVALVGGTVYTMDGDLTPRKVTVLVRDGRIESLEPAPTDGSSPSLPPGVRVIDVSGLYLLPGLLDGAVSHDSEHDELYVTSSVTLVRDTGNDVSRVLSQRLPRARERGPGPALRIAGPILDGSTAASAQALVLPDGPSAAARLTELFQVIDARAQALTVPAETLRPDFLSFHSGLGADAWRSLLAFAHGDVDLQVWGPAPMGASLGEVIAGGQDGMIGLQAFLPPEKGWHTVLHSELAPSVKAATDSDLAITPLLSVFARMLQDTGPAGEEAKGLPFLSPTYERLWRQEALIWKVQREERQLDTLTLKALATQRRVLLELWRGGVKLVPGSGSPNPWIPPGAGLLDELEQWVRAGIPRLEVLRLATAGAAAVIAPERGRLAPGQVADIVLTATDPAQGFDGLRSPDRVLLRGRVLERADLDEMRGRIGEHQAQARAQLAGPLEVEPLALPDGDVILSGRARKIAYGNRVSAERFAVVRTYDGRTAFVSHQVLPGGADTPTIDLQFIQYFKDGHLDTFVLTLDPRGEEAGRILAEGAKLGTSNRFSIRRRDPQGILDTQSASEPLTLVDVSDVLTALILGMHAPEGTFYVLSLEGPALAPEVDRWELALLEEDRSVHVRTSRGRMAMGLGADGVPVTFQRRVGSGITELEVDEHTTFGGPGLAIPAERVFLMPDPPTPEEATEEDEASSASDDGQP